MKAKMFEVGKIVNTHGVKGEVRVIRITDFEERFTPGETVYLVKKKEEPVPLKIVNHRKHKNFDLLEFEGLNNINDVINFKNSILKIKEEQLTDLPEGDYYYHEILDCAVYTTDNENIGIIVDILAPGANDVWVVKQESGKEVLIPFIKDVVKNIDILNKKVVIEVMEGLLD